MVSCSALSFLAIDGPLPSEHLVLQVSPPEAWEDPPGYITFGHPNQLGWVKMCEDG